MNRMHKFFLYLTKDHSKKLEYILMKINNINCCLSETIDFYWRVTYTLSEIMVQNLTPRLPLLRLSICFLLLTRLMYFIFLMEKFIEQDSAPFPNDTYLLVAKRLHLKCIWSLHEVQYPTIASLSRFTVCWSRMHYQ